MKVMAKLRRAASIYQLDDTHPRDDWHERPDPRSAEDRVSADCRWKDNCLEVRVNRLMGWSNGSNVQTPYDHILELSPGEMCDLVRALRDGAEAISETTDASEVLALILELALVLARRAGARE